MHSFVGRVVIGLLLAEGLYFGLRHLIQGFMLATRGKEELETLLASWNGRVLMELLHLIPLLLGGILAGAGQKRAFLLGFLIGLLNSGLCLLLAVVLTHQAGVLSWYGQPLLQGVFGSLGAWLGSTIWKPLVISSLSVDAAKGNKNGSRRRQRSLLSGRIAWFRVGLGVLLAVAGSLWAEFLFQAALRASGGQFETASYQQDRIFVWEVKALAVLFGGALAGATTANGFKQGLFVGTGATLILMLMPSSHATVVVAVMSVVSTFTLSIAGGWFGSQLLPPIIPRPTTRDSASLA